jgi:hypothetical protein
MSIEYLALPYTSGNASEELMVWRAEVSNFIFSELAKEGRIVYAPISSCHHIAVKYGLPRDWEFWKNMDEEFVRMCSKLIVIMLEGWETSTGLTAELKLAEKFGLEVEYLDPAPYIEKMKKLEGDK